MSSPAPTSFTEAEYLALERASDRNVTAALVVLTRGRGFVTMTSDQRVHVPATRLYALGRS